MRILSITGSIDFANPAALKRGEAELVPYYLEQLRKEMTILAENGPPLLVPEGIATDFKGGEIVPSLERLWPSSFEGGEEAFRAAMTFPIDQVDLRVNPLGIGDKSKIILGPVEILRLFSSGQLELDPGEALFCAGLTVTMPIDGRKGSFCLRRSPDSDKIIVPLFAREILIDDGDRCAAIQMA